MIQASLVILLQTYHLDAENKILFTPASYIVLHD